VWRSDSRSGVSSGSVLWREGSTPGKAAASNSIGMKTKNANLKLSKQQLKIGLVLPYDLARPGGVRSHIVGLGHALCRRGHEVHVICPAPGDQIEGLPARQCGRARKVRFSGTQIDWTWAGPADLRRVHSERYDVLHFHTIWNPLMPIQLALSWRGPKVTTFHDVPGPDTPGWARWLMPRASAAIRRWLVHEVIAVSPAAAEHLPAGSYTIIPNGLADPPDGSEAREDAILFLGRLEPRKGLEVLLRALALLGPEAPALRVAGDGPLRSSMEALTRHLGLRHVQFLGEVSEEQKWRLLRQAPLVVVPSLGGESFGIVLVEAMAAGAPPLAAANAGYAAVLKDQAQHLLTPVGDSRALADGLRRLRADSRLLQTLSDWGRDEWLRYRWDTLAPQVEELYARAGCS
jgi:phosphatidyl-myo-inositol alpha-mannosyltransferase